MVEKVDPLLRELMTTQAQRGDLSPLAVIVSLRTAANFTQLEELRAVGLKTRSTVGDIVTGTVLPNELARVAEHPLVVTIEASRSMYPDNYE